MDWQTVRYGDISVFYKPQLDGGGRTFGQQYIPVVRDIFGPVGSLCELSAGPGFIGFSLLASGLCRKLCLADINPEAIAACRKTVRENGLEKQVSLYVSDVFDSVPATERWDLIVGNPPHFDGREPENQLDLLLIDPGLQLHRKAYAGAVSHLRPDGSVLFVENDRGPDPEVWKRMVRDSGLHFEKTIRRIPAPAAVVRQNLTSLLSLRLFTPRVLLPYLTRRHRGMKTNRFLNIFHYPFYFIWCRKKSSRIPTRQS